MNEAEMY